MPAINVYKVWGAGKLHLGEGMAGLGGGKQGRHGGHALPKWEVWGLSWEGAAAVRERRAWREGLC
jgi:hypothetical protein